MSTCGMAHTDMAVSFLKHYFLFKFIAPTIENWWFPNQGLKGFG